MFANVTILKSSAKYHYYSNTANELGHTKKLGKLNSQLTGVTNGPINTTPPTSTIHNNSPEKNHTSSKKSLIAEKYSSLKKL